MELADVPCYHHARTLHLRVLSDTKEILTFPKAKIVDTNEVLGSPFFS